jgi:hypothetical protein
MMVEGTATKVSLHVERSKAVLRCVLVTESGRRLAVEMRADEIRGLVYDGDRVHAVRAHQHVHRVARAWPSSPGPRTGGGPSAR